MKAIDVFNYFVSVSPWFDSEKSVDKIIIGNPEKEVNSILVTLYCDFKALKYAALKKFDMIITHEPTFWVHKNEVDTVKGWDSSSTKSKNGLSKIQFALDNNLPILRLNDIWDRMPDIGMIPSWAKFLGFETAPAVVMEREIQTPLHRYDITPVTLDELAGKIAKRTATVGEPLIQVIGDGTRIVSKIGLGEGYGGSTFEFQDMGCDVSIVTDDGTTYWSDIKYAMDTNHSVIRVNHATSEECGIVNLTKYLNENFPELLIEHLPHKSDIRLVGSV